MPSKNTPMLPLTLCPLSSARNIIVRAGSVAVQVDEDVFVRGSDVLGPILRNSPRRPPGALTVLVLSDDGQDLLRYVDHVYNFAPRTPIALDVLRSLFYMGRKYDPSLFDAMSLIVATEFPPDLTQWDVACVAPFKVITWTAGIEFDLLDFAYEFDLYTAKPTLLYRICCIYSLGDRLSGIRRSNGTQARLTTKQQQVCTVAIHRLLITQRLFTLRWLHRGQIPVEGCGTTDVCQEFVAQTLIEVEHSDRPIRALQMWDASWNDRMCSACERHAKNLHFSGRREVWKGLPAHFDLRRWREAAEL
ncbi:hypothetical protein FPV67DRAFT_1675812 [Lyophyllum atratum]|nr:hypothetical protein FPV67DRAFT_1675812 [Lyophyllum atratum]